MALAVLLGLAAMSNVSHQVVPLDFVSAGTRLWRTHGHRRFTVVVKATFDIVHGSVMRPCEPDDLVLEDRFEAEQLIAPSEMAPYLGHCDLWLTGDVRLARPAAEAAVRFALSGACDKTLHAYGDVVAGVPAPFVRMPTDRSRAQFHARDNPIGRREPNLRDPNDPSIIAGFAATGAHPPGPSDGELDIPQGFEWSRFQATSSDQQSPFLRGDEWLVLEGFDERHPRLVTQLPGGRARVRMADADGVSEIGCVLDMLHKPRCSGRSAQRYRRSNTRVWRPRRAKCT